ncbi:M23 family metallopeptidase [Actinoalloteichus hymeniacidonis]|uniref:M23 family metallopeptidase n=1 Tax=Actinoalloteichus hymeniacidonis TaxID=340345 RepID=UPI0017EFFFAD|nr:M23 family metallopeptidase [Actinoalloteichus hymeniacidonis]MBB5907676.1 murein DD-endopeptidase MepM/ murein hydrolase activator NlpD [Actinoalloteichus hymeniacidonis]
MTLRTRNPFVRSSRVGKSAVSAVLAGAFLLGGQPLLAGATETPAPASADGGVTAEQDAGAAMAPLYNDVAPTLQFHTLAGEAQAHSARVAEQAAAEAEANRPEFVKPAEGTFTSGYGARWGTNHFGIDIAGPIGTPVVSATDGTVINAGPATGFGQWVRVQAPDGTITTYGHVETFTASVGEQVKAGDQIATIGNRGQSTGPHLHFEVNVGGQKIDPQPWLAERGITVQ